MLSEDGSRRVPGRPTRSVGRRAGMLAVGLVAALAAGCASGSTAGVGGRSAAAPPGARTDLRGICPDPIVVQTSWFSQVEHFVAYQLLGRGYTVDAGRKRVTGPLVAHGADTGVRIEIRAGGPAIGFQQVSAQMYADRSITLGMPAGDRGDDPVRRRPAGDHVGPGDVPGVQHDLRHRPDGHQGAVLQRRAHLHGLPARHRPAVPTRPSAGRAHPRSGPCPRPCRAPSARIRAKLRHRWTRCVDSPATGCS